MLQSFEWFRSLVWIVLQNFIYQINGWGHVGLSGAEYFPPLVCFDCGELELRVVRVHGVNLISTWCAQHFDDFYKLVDTRISGKQRLSEEELSDDAPD